MTARTGLTGNQLAILQSISADVAAAVDPIALAEHVVGELHARFGYELPSVYLLQSDGSLHLAAQIGYAHPYETIPAGSGVIGRVLHEQAPVLVRDVTSEPGFRFDDPDVVGEVCVPIAAAGQLFGVVNVETRRRGVLSERDMALLELLARMMAVALRHAGNAMQYRQMFEQNRAIQLLIEPRSGAIVEANQAACDFYGYSPDEIRTKTMADINTLSPSDVLAEMSRATHQERNYFIFEHRMASGAVRDVEVHSGPVNIHGRQLLYAIVHDITERKRTEEALAHQALHDGLTGLPNRLLLQDRLSQAIRMSQRLGRPFALCVIDLDRFKDVNDTLGHLAGDQLLQEVAFRLRKTLRASDTVARLGGDEFALVLPGADANAAMLAAEKVVEALGASLVLEGHEVAVGASAGIALFPENGVDADTLLRRADLAMYVAKQTRGGYALYTPDQDQSSTERLTLVGALRRAIADDELTLFYQPKVDCRTGVVDGVEALVRWQHPQQGLIQPDRFIPLAEQTGLIRPLTRWVLNAAMRQARAWHDEGLMLSVAVNLSAHDLADPGLPRWITMLLARWNLAPKWLKLELTESALMSDPGQALQVLTELCEFGTRIAIDDFGTGYSSLGYLKRLPAHEIKIDRSFVADMAAEERDRAIVRSTIDLGHNLGLSAVAEGVEDQHTLDLLGGLGCDLAQGFFLSRPLPASQVADWCRRRVDGPDLLAA